MTPHIALEIIKAELQAHGLGEVITEALRVLDALVAKERWDEFEARNRALPPDEQRD